MRKTAFAILIILAGLCQAWAQTGDQKHNLSVGINAGLNSGSVMFTPKIYQKSLNGVNAGVTVRYISEKYFSMICGAQVEVNLSQRGWDESYQDYPELSYTRKMNYVEVPFLAHMAFGKEQRGLQFFLNLGPQVAFFVSDSRTLSGDWSSYTGLSTEQHDKDVDNKFDYGIAGGGGFELKTKAGNFLIEGRYYYGLADFYGNSKKDYFSRSAHSGLTVKLTYLFDIWK